jgi:hypothetical protein
VVDDLDTFEEIIDPLIESIKVGTQPK